MNENTPCPVSAAIDRRENIEWSIADCVLAAIGG